VSETSRVSPPADPTRPKGADQSMGELVSKLTADIGDLVSTQIELAKVEIKEEVTRAGKGAGLLGGGAFAAYMGVLLVSLAAAWGLSEVVPEGVAFLIVGLVWIAAAVVLARKGRTNLQAVSAVPQRSIEEVKKDVEFAKDQLR
jgi:uncharacterized membrane protein YqjE